MNLVSTAITDLLQSGGSGNVTKEWMKNMPTFLENFLEGAKAFAINLLIAVVVCMILKKLIQVLLKFLDNVFSRSRMEEGLSKFLISLTRSMCHIGLFFVFVVIINGGKFGGLTAAITAIIGSAGLTIGLALQGSLQNFSGGVLILLLKPFKLGDFIIAQGYEGTVETIDIFYTKLLTIDNRMVVLPNGALSNTNITNVTREEVRRLDLAVGIEYSESVARVKEILLQLVESKEAVLKDRPMAVYISDFEASCVKMGIRMWCKTEDYWTLKCDMLESIKYAFDEQGINIPYNQLDINVKQAIANEIVKQ